MFTLKVKDLIKLLQQQDENLEVCIEAYNITEDYDDEENMTLEYEYYIEDRITAIIDDGKLLIVPK